MLRLFVFKCAGFVTFAKSLFYWTVGTDLSEETMLLVKPKIVMNRHGHDAEADVPVSCSGV